MDFSYPPADATVTRGTTINPNDLHTDMFSSPLFDTYCNPGEAPALPDLATVDSAVDLTTFHDQAWADTPVKMEPLDQFFDLGPPSQTTNTPSPSRDMIFSQANSPGDFIRDHSQTSSPETTNDMMAQDIKPALTEDSWKAVFPPSDAIHIPHAVETPQVHIFPDKTKTRAETQIKVQLVLDPLDGNYEYIHFPRKTLAKPKLLASPEEKQEAESKGAVIYMDLFLVCATAVEKEEGLEQAMRRARGEEDVPRRAPGIPLQEIEKDDPAHPQNGGEVVICEGCKERERKRYDRKKKRAEDEEEWWSYEADRVIMINEKEHKKWKDVEPGDHQYSPNAKQVEFAMRIACYCRHQEEKAPVGYRVIFTFKDANNTCLAQETSEIFQITDDHKNKDVLPEALPHRLTIPPSYVQTQYPPHGSNVVPVYQYPVDSHFIKQEPMSAFSQPPTPAMPNFHPHLSPVDVKFPPPTNGHGLPLATPQAFSNTASSVTAPQFPRPQPPHQQIQQHQPPAPAQAQAQALHRHQHSSYDTPMLSPTTQVPVENPYLPRPNSMDNFNFTSNIQYPAAPGFASAPPSAVSTPLNLSRPASPSWDQGPSNKKKMMCFYFYVDDDQQ